ncbi:MAG: peptide ABC transporter substrate-binding protein [Candidatus Eremiobacteraeota bacterium]|nr:peptide ABC transporter substrate-binding protein [Candidatus Eremiobacteraeota bacterium]
MIRSVGLLAFSLVIAACSAHSADPAGAPRAQGSVRFDLAADPTNLNPLFLHQDASSVEQQLARLSFEPFLDLDSHGRDVPALLSVVPSAANGGISADGRTLVYHLRRGVRWSDGQPVTSADVLYTLHAILDPRNPVRSHEGYDLIDRADARGPLTVMFHLKHAWAPALRTYFSYGFSPQFVLPAHVLRNQEPLAQAAFNANPTVGDGPYTFVRWTRGESLLYRANPRYWRGIAKAQRLDIRIIPDPSTNLVMLGAGQLDWNLIAPVQQANLSGKPGLDFRVVPTAVVAGIAMNTAHRPLDDPRMRRALAMSIDRAGISRKITLGRYPVTNMLQPQFSWAYDASVREPGYNPAAADALFDATGYRRGPGGMRVRDGKPLAIVYVQFPESTTGVRVATAVQAELRDRGVDVSLKSISNAQLFLPGAQGGTLASGNFDMAYVPWTMGADPDDSSILGCGRPANYMRYCSAAVDRLERLALASASRGERKRLYGEIGRIVARDVPVIYLFNAEYIYAYRARLRGFSPNAFLPTWNAFDWSIK